MNSLMHPHASESLPEVPEVSEVKQAFLERLMKVGNVTVACAQLKLPRPNVYYWKRRDKEFWHGWELAMAIFHDQFAQDVVDTARELGLGKWTSALDEDGCLLLDDDFNPIMVMDVSHVDTRILSKLIDKLVSSVDGPNQTNLQVNSTTAVHASPSPMPRLVRPSAADNVIDAELITEEAEDG